MKKTAENQDIKRLLLIDGIIYEIVKLDKDKEDCRLNCDWYHDAICTGLNCPIAQVSEEFDSHLKLYKSQSLPPVSEEEIIDAACERIPREKTFAIQRQLAFIQGAKWALSRLPQRDV